MTHKLLRRQTGSNILLNSMVRNSRKTHNYSVTIYLKKYTTTTKYLVNFFEIKYRLAEPSPVLSKSQFV